MEKFLAAYLFFIPVFVSCQDSAHLKNRHWEVRMTKTGEPGKKFTLDITVQDISTRQPIKDAEIFAYHINYKGAILYMKKN